MRKQETLYYVVKGGGGWRCYCCNDPKGSKARRNRWRAAKRRAKREAMKFEESQNG
jgi:hypothetical protein